MRGSRSIFEILSKFDVFFTYNRLYFEVFSGDFQILRPLPNFWHLPLTYREYLSTTWSSPIYAETTKWSRPLRLHNRQLSGLHKYGQNLRYLRILITWVVSLQVIKSITQMAIWDILACYVVSVNTDDYLGYVWPEGVHSETRSFIPPRGIGYLCLGSVEYIEKRRQVTFVFLTRQIPHLFSFRC